MRTWDDHRLILALHRYGTLRATAQSLNVTHTTVARRLAAIEAQEPSALFTRQNRAYKVTPYGSKRVALAESMEELDYAASRIQKNAEGVLSGPLSLSVSQAVLQHLMLDTLADFTESYPEIDLTVTGTDHLANLDRGEADIVIRGHPSPPGHLVGRKICNVGLSYYAHRDYLKNTPPQDMKWIVPKQTKVNTKPDWVASSPYPNSAVGIVIEDIQSRFLALEYGLGLLRAACFMADTNPKLVRLTNEPATPLYGLWVLTHPDLRKNQKVSTLMNVLSQALSNQRDLITG